MSTRRCLLVGYSGALLNVLGRDFEVLAVALEEHAALEAAMRFRPHTAVIGLEPGGGGLEIAQLLREACPELALTYLTSDADTYLRITPVSRNQLVSDARQAIPRSGDGAAQTSTGLASGPRVTAREREVLSRLVRGLSMKQVARELNITPRTVAFHKYKAMEANGLRSNADLIDFARRNGLLPSLPAQPAEPELTLA